MRAFSLEHVERTNDRGGSESPLWRLQGQLLLARDKRDETEAELSLQKAFAVARQQRIRLLELVAATDLARLWRQQGRHEAARELLEPIYARFSEGFDSLDLRAAKVLLDELSGASR